MANVVLDIAVVSFTLVFSLYLKQRGKGSRLPLPPGPKKLPIIGNLLDVPKSFEWITYHNWCKEFGSDIIHLNIAGTSIIVLDNAQLATELLEKRSSIYSSRAQMTMIRELMGWGYNLAFMPYGESWRRSRRLLHQELHPAAVIRFQPHVLKATRGLLRRLMVSSDDLMGELLQMAGETVMLVGYGISVDSKDDPYITTAEKGVHGFQVAIMPGAFLVDSIPILKYVPDWMPFAGFKRKAKYWRRLALEMRTKPYEAAKRNILARTLYVMIVQAAQVYPLIVLGKTMAAIATGIIGLLTNPMALKKAQEEIDRIVGPDHLPTFDDEDSLPYITAITKEALRWRSITPIGTTYIMRQSKVSPLTGNRLGVPHVLDADDEYNGYWLSKGSVIIPNAWAMLHDETVYPKPFDFDPDRWLKDGKLNPDVRDSSHVIFGFGRRVCPGRFMAYSSVWIAIASMIAVFNIEKARDADGKVIEPSLEISSGLLCKPLPFKCSITPRSKKAEGLIKASANEEYYLS
ncbi:hypothetical protein C0992_002520 [Termitomyces sp. T32_za158]|nr:hypothetical protein C0992_002520 [Termitomyces sp. T32_za158]